MLKALIDAAARGVDVKLILPGVPIWLVFHAGASHYGELLRGGVKIYERQEALLHAKTAVIDGVWSTVGSSNLDWRSFLHNAELNAVILGTDFGAKMRAAFERDLAASDAITLEAWEHRPLGARVKEMFARLWEYWPEFDKSLPLRALRSCAASGWRLAAALGPASAQDAATLHAPRGAAAEVRQQPVRPAAGSRVDADLRRPEGRRLRRGRPSLWIVRQALQSIEHWCDILILHLNVKSCQGHGSKQAKMLSCPSAASSTSRSRTPTSSSFAYRVAASKADYLQVQLNADEGPFSTRDYRIRLEAVPVDAKRTVLHMSYSYGYGFAARMAMQAYLATIGSAKVGFTIVDRKDGKPVFQGGVLGLVERNTMRYYLAIDAYLAAYALPAAEQPERRIRDWYASTERYATQLHEMEQAEYLEMKRKEMRRQQEG